MENKKIFENDSWLIELRPRNLVHEGEPNMKVWVLRNGQEVAHYSNKYRGYGYYQDHEELLPPKVSAIAKKTWEKLKEGPIDDATVAELVAGEEE